MNTSHHLRRSAFICVLFVSMMTVFAYAESVDTIQVHKISSQDQRAVVKTADGKMKIVKVGDELGEHGKIVEISQDKIIVQETKDKALGPVIIRLEGGKQKVQRLKKGGEPKPLLFAPAGKGEKSKSK